jgi:hypothetical protein
MEAFSDNNSPKNSENGDCHPKGILGEHLYMRVILLADVFTWVYSLA